MEHSLRLCEDIHISSWEILLDDEPRGCRLSRSNNSRSVQNAYQIRAFHF